jgi:XTP/dITP diphosphohydrolase
VTIPRLLVATTNIDKLHEIRDVLGGVPTALVALSELPPVDEPEETGATFDANARLKATYYAAAYGMPTVAEDSGLAIDALGGEPGVRSARFLRPDASYPERFAAIYRGLAEHPERPRTARFVCALAVVHDGTVVFETEGAVEGQIVEPPRGAAGFGYDPIFYYPRYGRTLGEVDREMKLRVAHRGVAFRRLSEWLRTA